MESLLIVPKNESEFSFLKELLDKLNIATQVLSNEQYNEISYKDKVYRLLLPLSCVLEKEEDYFVMRNELLDLVGTGQTKEKTKESFFEEFAFAYTRLNELADSNLSDRLLKIKQILNFIVL